MGRRPLPRVNWQARVEWGLVQAKPTRRNLAFVRRRFSPLFGAAASALPRRRCPTSANTSTNAVPGENQVECSSTNSLAVVGLGMG